jgi:hypothetical protein
MAGYPYNMHQSYHDEPKVQYTNMLSMPNGYFASTSNSHVDVATYSDSILISSASNYSDDPNHTYQNSEYVQKLMSTTCSVSFNGISNIQHAPAYSHSSTIEQIESCLERMVNRQNQKFTHFKSS